MLNEYHKIGIAKEQGVSSGGSSYNTRCEGNPGTGKTTVAELYAKFLIEMEILPEDSIVEKTTGSSLLSSGVPGLKKHLEAIKKAGGGVIFLDEAYQLSPKDDREG